MSHFTASLASLGITVSTGRVVDFRAKEYLRHEADDSTVPLIYPANFQNGFIGALKAGSKKHGAIVSCQATADLLVDTGCYVLCKRFSAKEERRRLVAAVFDPKRIPGLRVGIENHLNYFHQNGKALDRKIATGLAVFLNSSLVDLYFRQFSGHTQVNATDLRALPYPRFDELRRLGLHVGETFPSQDEVDSLLEAEIMSDRKDEANPLAAVRKIDDAMSILKDLGIPKAQLNERSALTLLALLDMTPEKSWKDAAAGYIGITPIMTFIAEKYGKTYAPNTRETIRRFTMHQFVEAGFAVANPDDPARPVNSPKYIYQIAPAALALFRFFGSASWNNELTNYLKGTKTLLEKYARERDMERIPVKLASGNTITLSPGGQNPLIKHIVESFCSRFTPGGALVYIGDADKKWAFFDEMTLAKIGVTIRDEHGKMPDVVVYHTEKNWLVLIEAVTSHGPVNPKRRQELETLFRSCRAGLVFVTAFETRKAMTKYVDDISWETEVWVAEAPTHLIHFNGERFLGPYE
jgi:adenine-specific DNA-methyltransferase